MCNTNFNLCFFSAELLNRVQYDGCVMSLVQHDVEALGLEAMIKSVANINDLNTLLIKKAEADSSTSADCLILNV